WQRGARQQEHVPPDGQHEEKAEPSHAEKAQRLHPFVRAALAAPIAEPIDDRKDPDHDERRRQRHPRRRRRRQSRGNVGVAGQQNCAHDEDEWMKEPPHRLMLSEPVSRNSSIAVSMSYIAPTILMAPEAPRSASTSLRRWMSAIVSRTFARATASRYASSVAERSPAYSVACIAGWILASSPVRFPSCTFSTAPLTAPQRV